MQKTRTLLKLRTARKCQKRVFWTYHMLYACTVLVITYSVYSVLLQALALAPTAYQYITRQASCTSFTPDVSCPNSLLLFSHVALMRRVHACNITFCTHQVLYPPHEYDRLLRKRNHHNKAHHWKCSWLFQSTKRTSIPKLRQREAVFSGYACWEIVERGKGFVSLSTGRQLASSILYFLKQISRSLSLQHTSRRN